VRIGSVEVELVADITGDMLLLRKCCGCYSRRALSYAARGTKDRYQHRSDCDNVENFEDGANMQTLEFAERECFHDGDQCTKPVDATATSSRRKVIPTTASMIIWSRMVDVQILPSPGLESWFIGI
jgi:hypothetical protein